MNKQTKTYYGGASEIAPVCWKVSVLEKRAQKGVLGYTNKPVQGIIYKWVYRVYTGNITYNYHLG